VVRGGDRQDLLDSIGGGNACAPSSPNASQNAATCEEIRSASSDERTYRAVGIGGLAVGAAALAATLAYTFWPRDQPSSQSELTLLPQLVPHLGPDPSGRTLSGGLSASVSF
jgi:hypothetical protein